MDTILQKNILKQTFWKRNLCVLVKITLEFVSKGPIDNKSELIQVMAWHWTGNKPLSEPAMTHFPDAYGCFNTEMPSYQ